MLVNNSFEKTVILVHDGITKTVSFELRIRSEMHLRAAPRGKRLIDHRLPYGRVTKLINRRLFGRMALFRNTHLVHLNPSGTTLLYLYTGTVPRPFRNRWCAPLLSDSYTEPANLYCELVCRTASLIERFKPLRQ